MSILDNFYCDYDLHDPLYGSKFLNKKFVDSSTPVRLQKSYNLVFINVAHTEYTNYDYTLMLEENHLIMDVKNILTKDIIKTQKLNVVKL